MNIKLKKMNIKLKKINKNQDGISIIEVLIAMLVLSFGILSLGVMLSFSMQVPKLSGYRGIAINLSSSYIEQMRANTDGFVKNFYKTGLTYDGTFTNVDLQPCSYPNCTSKTIADMDTASIEHLVRANLPAGGILMRCETLECLSGNLWIVWQEPKTMFKLQSNSDNCPQELDSLDSSIAKPRCIYIRFKV